MRMRSSRSAKLSTLALSLCKRFASVLESLLKVKFFVFQNCWTLNIMLLHSCHEYRKTLKYWPPLVTLWWNYPWESIKKSATKFLLAFKPRMKCSSWLLTCWPHSGDSIQVLGVLCYSANALHLDTYQWILSLGLIFYSLYAHHNFLSTFFAVVMHSLEVGKACKWGLVSDYCFSRPFLMLFWYILHSLRGKAQVQNLLRYVVDEPPENAGSKRAFKWVAWTPVLNILPDIVNHVFCEMPENTCPQSG